MHSEPPAEAGGTLDTRHTATNAPSNATGIDLTNFQKLLHGLSSKQSVRSKKTKGAFGGVTKD